MHLSEETVISITVDMTERPAILPTEVKFQMRALFKTQVLVACVIGNVLLLLKFLFRRAWVVNWRC